MNRTIAASILAVPLLAGCAHKQSAYTPVDPSQRDSTKADHLNQEAAIVMSTDPVKAETLLRDALTNDLYHCPAHNNLGVLFLTQGKLYEAAGEFEWARKLLPGHPDPRLNLSLVFEKAGRFDEALQHAKTALEVHPGDIASLEQLSRLQLMHAGTKDNAPAKRGELKEIALRGESPARRDLARLQLVKS